MENDRYTVITGASSGIGYEAAKAFASRGKNLIIAARREDRLKELRREIQEKFQNVDVVVISTDLSVPENAHKFYKETTTYPVETWVNNAGFGNYDTVAHQNLEKIERMLCLNVETVVILSSLYTRDYQDKEGTQLINVASCGGYVIVPNAVTYCATKFFVSTFTEGLARELQESGAKLRAKVFAPAATETEFALVANDVEMFDYDKQWAAYHTRQQAAAFLLELYDSDQTVGLVDRETFVFSLHDPMFQYAGGSKHNQKIVK